MSASLALGLVDAGNRTMARRVKEQGTRGETAHALLEECLAETGAGIGDIVSICVGVGPGSFTGIRVCAALAQGLAFAKRLSLYPFSSLAALEVCAGSPGDPLQSVGLPAPRRDGEPAHAVIAAIAANAGRYYVRLPPAPDADPGAGGGTRESLMSADALLSLGAPGIRLITSGNFPDRDRFLPAFGFLDRFEDAADFGRIARMARGGHPVVDGILRPNYLMASAAEEKRRSALPGMPESGDTSK
ncbi:MAG: tRNA ((37)-N6)-threonylcarbamoyltransferase complex dimerization subunit type 1 TsaB [Fibrobacteres bacterium]|nr:tRNA ((37)-N6)-threonylcarbamoyltransferase complex dimerization subunit type 1 TsaB [Fibrobacterota bacterium]